MSNFMIKDPEVFVDCCKQSLLEILSDSSMPDRNPEEFYAWQEFIKTEATDYEVLSLTFTNSLPEKRKNKVLEEAFLMEGSSLIADSAKVLTEMIGPVEFGNMFLSEFDVPFVGKKAREERKEKKDFDSGVGKEAWAKGMKNTKRPQFGPQQAGKMKQSYWKNADKIKTGIKNTGTTAASYGLKGVMGAKGLESGITDKGGFDFKAALKGGGKRAKIGTGVTVAAILAAMTYAGYKVYQKVFNQYAKECKGVSGTERNACIKNARANALKGQIETYKARVNSCVNAKNPEKCKNSALNKIAKVENKLQKLA